MSKTEKAAVAAEKTATKTPGGVTPEDKLAARQKLVAMADTKPAKEPTKEVKADKAAASKVAMGIVKYEKALKWKYPEEVVTAKDRKLFRAKHRNELRKLARELEKMEGKEREKHEKALNHLKKEFLLNPETWLG
jgi:hypothetical protein